jgi:two-component system, cell cycle sensor histidine kinase and response regulator CckA
MSPDPPLKEFADHADSVLWVLSPKRTLTYVSPAFEEIWGRPVSSVLGPLERFMETVHPDDVLGLTAWVREGFQQAERRATEYRILRPDGTERWIRTRAFPVDPEADGERLAAGISDDITEHRLRQDAVEETSRRLARTIDSLHEAVFIVDASNRTLTECNAAASRIFGYSREEIIGAPTRLLHASDRAHAEFGEASRAALAAEGTFRSEFTMRRKDGSLFESEHTVSLLNPEGGNEEGVVSVVRDLSGEKELERRLYHAQRLEAVGRLAGGVAHDFNNLLTVILSNAELLGEDPTVPENARALLDEIREASVRGADVTGQLLAFGRRQLLEPRSMDLADVLREMERLLVRLMGEDVRVRLDLPEGEAAAEVDQSRLEQAILNMAMNARQAMPEGGELALVVRREETLPARDRTHFPEAGPGPHVLLEVKDTGRGMDRETLERIFEPFFTTRAQDGGTGLGLPSVYGMVTQSGGSIAVESAPGKGTSFTLCFPVSTRPAQPVQTAPAQPSDIRGGGETLLVVEDDDAVRRALARILGRAGYQVIAAGSAEEGLELLAAATNRVDLCLTDLILPGESGLRLLETLRRDHPGMRTLLMSGYSEERLAIVSEDVGKLQYLPKPFSPQEVVAKVRETLDRRVDGPPGPPPTP